MNTVIAIILGYLSGSIPSAYIAGRLKKRVDIREVGGQNMGALNVIREIGWSAGFIVLFSDVGKGILAVLIARWLDLSLPWVLVAGFAAVAGHNWPIFLKFRGGKGGATIMGVLLALVPLEFMSGFVVTAIIVIITSNPALGMGIGLAFVPLFIWWYNGSGLLIGYSIFLALFVTARFIISGLKKSPEGIDSKKGLIFSKEYHFWQVKKDQQ